MPREQGRCQDDGPGGVGSVQTRTRTHAHTPKSKLKCTEAHYETIKQNGYSPRGCNWWFQRCELYNLPYITYKHTKGHVKALIEWDFITVEKGIGLDVDTAKEVYAALYEARYSRSKSTYALNPKHSEIPPRRYGYMTVSWRDTFEVLDIIAPLILDSDN